MTTSNPSTRATATATATVASATIANPPGLMEAVYALNVAHESLETMRHSLPRFLAANPWLASACGYCSSRLLATGKCGKCYCGKCHHYTRANRLESSAWWAFQAVGAVDMLLAGLEAHTRWRGASVVGLTHGPDHPSNLPGTERTIIALQSAGGHLDRLTDFLADEDEANGGVAGNESELFRVAAAAYLVIGGMVAELAGDSLPSPRVVAAAEEKLQAWQDGNGEDMPLQKILDAESDVLAAREEAEMDAEAVGGDAAGDGDAADDGDDAAVPIIVPVRRTSPADASPA